MIKSIKLEGNLMINRALLSLLVIVGLTHSDASIAATARRSARAPVSGTTAQPAQNTQSAPAATSARAASSRGAARAPVSGNTTAPRATAARSATPKQNATSAPKTVAARAGTTQKVISTGTKVTTATQNVIADEECTTKYNGCMDSFCMMDNANGGRCVCSDKSMELNKALAEIEKIDEQSYQMATVGIEQIEMGSDADAVMSMANNVANSIRNRDSANKSGERKLDFSAFDTNAFEEIDVFKSASQSDATPTEGDALYKLADQVCSEQIPECSASLKTIKLLYSQQVKSDCMAYENTIKKKRNESSEKLAAAERALREAALESYQNANKYNLGQCTIRFRECMQSTGGCGDDFSGCTNIFAMDSTNSKKGSAANKKIKIKGATSDIEIAASTYDTLMAKKPLCESVTKQCVAVADQVWDTFLQESAPQIKSAELISENNTRQNCLNNVSECFQQACKDNMDPNDPDGSYDMCLSRPETMFNVCKIPLNACGIDTTKKNAALKSDIWKHITARLAAIRVDACTTSVRDCLQSNDRCGTDYTQCIGLDLNAIMDMCPLEKLVACDSSDYRANTDEKRNSIANVAQGIFLNIDNNMLQACENAINTKMIEICGSTNYCSFADANTMLGTGSIKTQQGIGPAYVTGTISENDYVISGLIEFDNIKLKHPTSKTGDWLDFSNENPPYTINYSYPSPEDTGITNVINGLQSELNRKISLLANDPTVHMCLTGREMSQISGNTRKTISRTAARFPNLINSYAETMFASLLTTARDNYQREYAREISRANSQSRELQNIMMCNAMAALSFTNAADSTEMLKNLYETKDGELARDNGYIILSGASTKDIIAATQTNATETRQIEIDDLQIAAEEITSMYEPGPQVCRLTRRLYACTGYEAIYNTNSSSWNVGLEGGWQGEIAGVGTGISGGIGFGGSNDQSTHQGNFCNSYAEPVISEQIISFASGEAVFGDVSRSNLQSNYQNNSSSTSISNDGFNLSLSAAVSTNQVTEMGDNSGTINNNQSNFNTTNNQGEKTDYEKYKDQKKLEKALEKERIQEEKEEEKRDRELRKKREKERKEALKKAGLTEEEFKAQQEKKQQQHMERAQAEMEKEMEQSRIESIKNNKNLDPVLQNALINIGKKDTNKNNQSTPMVPKIETEQSVGWQKIQEGWGA